MDQPTSNPTTAVEQPDSEVLSKVEGMALRNKSKMDIARATGIPVGIITDLFKEMESLHYRNLNTIQRNERAGLNLRADRAFTHWPQVAPVSETYVDAEGEEHHLNVETDEWWEKPGTFLERGETKGAGLRAADDRDPTGKRWQLFVEECEGGLSQRPDDMPLIELPKCLQRERELGELRLKLYREIPFDLPPAERARRRAEINEQTQAAYASSR